MTLVPGLIVETNMNSKRIQAIRYYLMASSEKTYVIKNLSNDVANQLIQYAQELDAILPRNITDEEKKYLLGKLVENNNSDDITWVRFSESVNKRMSAFSVFPSRLREALME